MNKGIRTIIYPVREVAKAKKLYNTLLGIKPFMDEAWYVGYKVGDQEIGLDPNGHKQGMTGPVGYVHVEDIRTSLRDLLSNGALALQEIREVGGGKLTATVKDPDGNLIGLIQMPS